MRWTHKPDPGCGSRREEARSSRLQSQSLRTSAPATKCAGSRRLPSRRPRRQVSLERQTLTPAPHPMGEGAAIQVAVITRSTPLASDASAGTPSPIGWERAGVRAKGTAEARLSSGAWARPGAPTGFLLVQGGSRPGIVPPLRPGVSDRCACREEAGTSPRGVPVSIGFAL